MIRGKGMSIIPSLIFLTTFIAFTFQSLEIQRLSSTVFEKGLFHIQFHGDDTTTKEITKNDDGNKNDDEGHKMVIPQKKDNEKSARISPSKYSYHPKENTIESNKHQTRSHTPLVPNNTRFTPHILHLVDYYQNKMSYKKECGFNITISNADSMAPSAEPNVTAEQGGEERHMLWIRPYLQAFQNRIFYPGNNKYFLPSGTLKITISYGDKMEAHQHCAFANSARKGEKTVYNPQDVQNWAANISLPDPLPWSERKKIPVWRGTGWGSPNPWTPIDKIIEKYKGTNLTQHEISEKAFEMFLNTSTYHGRNSRCYRRNHLVYFSKQHPDLVDARLYSLRGLAEKHWHQNATNGLHNLLPLDIIPESEYYTEYQTHIIMGGIGAAYRTARVLRQSIAVILQDFPYEEWFVHEMKPYVNFIPIKQDLSDLKETLEWVRDNPQKVLEIAKKGKEFYDEYLSYEAMGEFYYELILRLMLCCAHKSLI
ncbi:hypothetical protein CTEN210_06262 [Chaetoceros tenuissimus]|uniref:Glycosyl transferase CAP10 domain-containing protein n=1 Tax=Chaetoceros tenuissimus TaxID=426638 RepID=A0AAD3H499_9STRA|nr:hypothetical protein CTEN210_06262 [Chaetoceros tenuissimus]